MMKQRAFLTLAAIACAACSEVTTPDGLMREERVKSGTELWNTDGNTAGGSSTKRNSGTSVPSAVRLADWAPPLTTYDTTFIAVQGKPSSHAIYFVQQPWMLSPVKFMQLDIPSSAEFVDATGTPVPRGTVVAITVHADNGYLSFQFGPHGSQFSVRKPATLWVWWLFADLGSLSAEGLQLWYQGGTTEPWNPLSTTVDMVGGYLVAPVYHFSNYAVAW